MGELHLDIMVDRMKREFGVESLNAKSQLNEITAFVGGFFAFLMEK
jgi:translation elongation factor EF-4